MKNNCFILIDNRVYFNIRFLPPEDGFWLPYVPLPKFLEDICDQRDAALETKPDQCNLSNDEKMSSTVQRRNHEQVKQHNVREKERKRVV